MAQRTSYYLSRLNESFQHSGTFKCSAIETIFDTLGIRPVESIVMVRRKRKGSCRVTGHMHLCRRTYRDTRGHASRTDFFVLVQPSQAVRGCAKPPGPQFQILRIQNKSPVSRFEQAQDSGLVRWRLQDKII